MISLLLFALKLLPNLLGFLQSKDENKRKATELDVQYQIEFLKSTSGIETQVMRQLIIAAFAIALFSPTWGAILSANAKSMPVYGWFVLGWEFIGRDALYILPWFSGFKGNGGNGNGNSPITMPNVPARVDNPDTRGH
jgi:hypothetical protein